MWNRRILVAASCALIGALVAAQVHASGRANRTSYLTFSRSIALPGVTLAAGKYSFESDSTNSDVVLVRDRNQIFFLGLTRKIDRPPGMRDDHLVTFGEAPPGVPVPITAWYPAGDRMGHQFLYAKR
jgi:hypothetical protein